MFARSQLKGMIILFITKAGSIWNWQENQEAIESMAEIRRVFKGQINGTESWS